MKTMLWKELRENFKWATLAFLCLLLAEFYSLASPRQAYSESYNDLTLCSSAFLMVTAFGSSAFGAALALVQFLPELRRDQWAALLHRPVPRSTIFFGKVLAGMLLYFGAATLPFIASACYVATPGQFAAPLVPGMLIPGLSDLFLGPVFYFAAILLCLHRGGWFGSRGAIGLSLVPIFILHLLGGWPFLLPIFCALIYLVAAWGAMLSNGALQNRPRAGRFALVLVVMMGTETALLILVAGLQFLPAKKTVADSTYTDFEITQDGEVFLSTQHGDGSAVLTDMNGKVVTDPRYTGNNGTQSFCQLLPFSWELRKKQSLRDSYIEQSPRNLFNYLREIDDPQGKEIWYLLIGRNYFIGYDRLSRRAVGICDADGFKSPTATPKPFAQPLRDSIFSFRNPRLYWSGTQLYALDFPERSMVTFDAPNDSIYGAIAVAASYLSEKLNYIAVALENQIRFFDAQGKVLMAVPYPHDPNTWTSLSIGTNDAADRIYLESMPSPDLYWTSSHPTSPKQPVYLDEIDALGNIVHTYSRPDTNSTISIVEWTFQPSILASSFLPALIGTLYSNLFPSNRLIPLETLDNFSLPQTSFQVDLRDLAILFVSSLVFGMVALLWARHAGFSERPARRWALFVFCFGLPGMLTFRLASNWPAKVRCPQCGQRRPIETEACPSCHQLWPSPHSTGREIFDFDGPKAIASTSLL
jgi:hypothetical protein